MGFLGNLGQRTLYIIRAFLGRVTPMVAPADHPHLIEGFLGAWSPHDRDGNVSVERTNNDEQMSEMMHLLVSNNVNPFP
jgi:hypothetical protein